MYLYKPYYVFFALFPSREICPWHSPRLCLCLQCTQKVKLSCIVKKLTRANHASVCCFSLKESFVNFRLRVIFMTYAFCDMQKQIQEVSDIGFKIICLGQNWSDAIIVAVVIIPQKPVNYDLKTPLSVISHNSKTDIVFFLVIFKHLTRQSGASLLILTVILLHNWLVAVRLLSIQLLKSAVFVLFVLGLVSLIELVIEPLQLCQYLIDILVYFQMSEIVRSIVIICCF